MTSADAPTPVGLVIDATPSSRSSVIELLEKTIGWKALSAASAKEAIAVLANDRVEAIVTDLQLPDSDGIKFLKSLQKSHPTIPVIIVTESGHESLALKAIQEGAATYVPRAELEDELAESLERVASAARAVQNRNRLLSFLRNVEMEFVLENDPVLIPVLVAQVQDQLSPFKITDQPGKIRIGVALEEAVLNAMYHGNLEVSSELRQEDDRKFTDLVAERRTLLPYKNRLLRVHVSLTHERAKFVITDEGPGFDPSKLPDPTDPENLDTVGGRGLLLIRTFMDHVHFNDQGNQITFSKHATHNSS